MPDWLNIEQEISVSLGQPFKLKKQPARDGPINKAIRIEGFINDKAVSFFIKFNQKEWLPMFQAEVAGLQEIAQTQAIRVPQIICSGVDDRQSYLVLEYLPFTRGVAHSASHLGQQLARLHQNQGQQFGWYRDNSIGATQQLNTQTKNWLDFWRENRLGFQLSLAKQNGAGPSLIIKGEKLLLELESFFNGYEPEISLLHGDFWSGNYGYIDNGDPVIFDPAVYYGDREADIAMTELFGGFPAEFYAAYQQVWPLHEGYPQRKNLYNLYHILNHYNLFGVGYAMQAENMIDQLLRKNGI